MKRFKGQLLNTAIALGVMFSLNTGFNPALGANSSHRKLKPVNMFKAQVIRVIDGDTIGLRVELLPDIIIKFKARLRGVDTSEIHAKCRSERIRAKQQKAFTEAALAGNFIWVTNLKFGKYAGRRITTVLIEKGEYLVDLSKLLKENGMVKHKCDGV